MANKPCKHPVLSIAEIWAATADPDLEITTESGWAFNKARGDAFTHMLSFGYEAPWRIVLTAYGTDGKMVSSLFHKLPTGLYRLHEMKQGHTANQMFDAHTKYVADLAKKEMERSMFKMGQRFHLTDKSEGVSHAA